MNELVTVVITVAVCAVIVGAWFTGAAYGVSLGKESGRQELLDEIDAKLAERHQLRVPTSDKEG